jgi:phytoene dehydrogenase-like protein
MPDVVVVGSGPNGLSAAVSLARAGASVLVLEAEEELGGGTRTAELTLPGFRHDVCSGAHPLGILSPFFAGLPLAEHGLSWIRPQASVAHPLEGEPAVLLFKSLAKTAQSLGDDGVAYQELLRPFLDGARTLIEDVLDLPGFPHRPLLLARFGLLASRAAAKVAKARLKGPRARALFAGCAAHSVLPLEQRPSAAIGLLFLIAGHTEEWPVAKGGSSSIANALASYLRALGGEVQTGRRIGSLEDLPPARVFLYDTSPRQLAAIAGPALPRRYLRALQRFRYGPGTFKLDWALDGPIPWKDPSCLLASTVHLGGTLEELAAAEAAVARGEHARRPFVLVVQQSQFDPSRAPPGKQTGYAYCHVPQGSKLDQTEAIEAQVERFAPGFRSRVLARHAMSCGDFERHNPNLIGGAITGGMNDLWQTLARPVPRFDPHATPNPRVYLCSASTPPGAGVHGMCGARAARSAMKQLSRQPFARL